MIGTEIHNYRITEKIGEGGMATVYKAVHKALPGLVRAVKMMNPVLGIDDAIKGKFIIEASAMATLDHPSIVKIHDYVEQNGNLFLVMEYVEGKSLEELIKTQTGPIPEERAKKIFSKILDAIGYAHSKGIIHRDIKPSNILITSSDEPKIIDFGIVKILEDDHNSGKTKTGSRIGTPLYMSPEQILAKDVDKRSDIYALGVTLFQMITGRVPYDHTLSEFEILTKIVNEPLPRVREIYPAASSHIQSIIDKASAKKRDDRFQNCEEFRSALLMPVPGPFPIPGPRPVPPMPVRKKSRAGVVVGICVGALLLVGIVVFFVVRSVNKAKAEGFYADGRRNLGLSKYAEATADFSKAIELNHSFALAYRDRGRAKVFSNQYGDAIADLDKAIQLNSNDDTSYNARGIAKRSLNRYDEGVLDFDKAIEIDPGFWWAYLNKAILEISTDKYQSALTDCNVAIKHGGNSSTVFYYRGIAEIHLEDNSSAIKDLTKSIDLNSTDAMAYFYRGLAKANLKNYYSAIYDYDKSIVIDDTAEHTYAYRGLAYYNLDNLNAALADLNKAISLNDSYGWAYNIRGCIYQKGSMPDEACVNFRKSKDLGNKTGAENWEKFCAYR